MREEIKEKIEHIERARKAGLIPVEDVKCVNRWKDYANQNSTEDMELYRRFLKCMNYEKKL